MERLQKKERIRIYLNVQFESALSTAKRGYKELTNENLEKIIGMTNYAHYFGDISDASYYKIKNLVYLIRKKYDIC